MQDIIHDFLVLDLIREREENHKTKRKAHRMEDREYGRGLRKKIAKQQ